MAVALLGATAIGIGLLWFALLYVSFRDAAFVAGAPLADLGGAWAFDLQAYTRAAARLASEGSLYAGELIAAPFEPGNRDLFYYAPPFGVAMLPIAETPIADSSAVWYVLRIGALLLACLLMPVKPLIRALAFLAVAFTLWSMKDAILGNVSILLVLPLAIAWRWLDKPLGSVALAMAMSIRPGLGVYLLWQLLRRRWRAMAWTIGAGLMLVVLSLPFVGVDGYRDYLAVIGNLGVPAGPSENGDLGATVMALGGDDVLVGLARIASLVVGLVIVLYSPRREREVGFMLTLCASLLIVPLLWNIYLITLILPLALLADRLRPVVLLIPLLSWLPPVLTPFIVLAVVALLLLVRDRPLAASGEGPTPATPTRTRIASAS